MKVKALKKEFEVSDLTFAQKRKLHAKNTGIFWGSSKVDEMDSDKYYELLEMVLELSKLNEDDFKGLSMGEIDGALQDILKSYLGLTDSGKG